MANFCDYLIFVDESGDAGLKNINLDYPVLTLAFIVIHKDDYINKIVPSFTALKLKYWGHDEVVFHEHDIRKGNGDFAFFRADKALRDQFMNDLTELVAESEFHVISMFIDKHFLILNYGLDSEPYHMALGGCMFDLLDFLKRKNAIKGQMHIICEARGNQEDKLLKLEFDHIKSNKAYVSKIPYINFQSMDFQLRFADKKTNSVGLQLADLIARPIGIHFLRPEQENRAYDIIRQKMFSGSKLT